MNLNYKKRLGISTELAVHIFFIIVISIIIIPLIMSASQENDNTETSGVEEVEIEAEEVEIKDEKEQFYETKEVDEQEIAINPNSITREQAIAVVTERFHDDCDVNPNGDIKNTLFKILDAKYMESDGSTNTPTWYILQMMEYWGVYKQEISDGRSPEETLEFYVTDPVYIEANNPANQPDYMHSSIGTDNYGNTVIETSFHMTSYYVSEVNAYTGEWLRVSTIDTGITSLDGFELVDGFK